MRGRAVRFPVQQLLTKGIPAMSNVAIVLAASKGMGAACARELAQQGYRLAIMARSAAIHDVAAKTGAIALQGDATKLSDLELLCDSAVKAYGQVNGVVISTGHPARGDVLSISDESWHAGLELVFLNVVRVARLIVPVMQASGGGAIVNISTYAAREPSSDFPISSVVRAATSAFTKLFADRYAADNVRMNSILPGFIDSYGATQDAINRIPMRRAGSVREIAQTAAFLLSPASGYITGQSICVDGGLSRSF